MPSGARVSVGVSVGVSVSVSVSDRLRSLTLTLTLTLTTIGCGLGASPEASTPAPATGIAPWLEPHAAQICLGDQAFGPPASTNNGFCVRSGSTARACSDHAACGSREVCSCGRCTVAYCDADFDCAPPRVCSTTTKRCDRPCSSSAQCAAAEVCGSGGVCRGRCTDAGDCQQGEVCDAGVCVSAPCTNDGGCLAGERCAIQRVPRQVLEPGPIAGFGAPIVVYLDIAMPAQPDQRAIFRATSRDGVRFALDPATPVLQDPAGARAPSPVVDGNRLYLYYEQGDGLALRVATSSDGIAFDPPVTVLAGSATARVRHPSAVHVSGNVQLYYQRGDGTGLALASGGPQSMLVDQGVVLAPAAVEVGSGAAGTAFWVQVTRVQSPHAVLVGDVIRLFFSAFGKESADAVSGGMAEVIPPSFSVGYAAAPASAPAMLTVWPYGPVFDRVDALLEHREELGPAVLDAGSNRFFMYYIDATPTSLGRLGVVGSGASRR